METCIAQIGINNKLSFWLEFNFKMIVWPTKSEVNRTHFTMHQARPSPAKGGERSRPGKVLVFFVHFFTYKVRKIQPIAAGYYNWLLHYELNIEGQENGSHFLMKHTIGYYW